jgi:transcriptional regulator with XRE-family HTH domain
MHTFQERLKDLRIEHGYLQQELASILNMSTSAYGYYEQGRNEPSLETLKKVAETFGVSTDYLLGLTNTASTNYEFNDQLTLTNEEMNVVKNMKDLELLQELGEDPKNVERLQRCWKFIKNELFIEKKNQEYT